MLLCTILNNALLQLNLGTCTERDGTIVILTGLCMIETQRDELFAEVTL